MKFSIIVACTDDGIIGIDNQIPWYIPDDFKYFKKITSGYNELNKLSIDKNIVIMGKNTWQSITNKPLNNRINIILSNTLKLEKTVEDVYVYGSLDEIIEFIKTIHYNEIFIIGGEQVYNLVLNEKYRAFCNKIYLTRITSIHKLDKNKKIVTFPIEKLKDYKLIDNSKIHVYNQYSYVYEKYEQL